MNGKYAHFHELPIASVRPEGWLKEFLVRQTKGLTGLLPDEIYPWNTCMWSGKISKPKNAEKNPWWDPWWPYEQTAYYLDGALRCGLVLGDKALTERIRGFIRPVIRHPSKDGILGPAHIHHTRWPHAVFFRALEAEYSASRDVSVLRAMERHFNADMKGYKPRFGRDIAQVEHFCWLYQQTGKAAYLQYAEKAYAEFCNEGNKWTSIKLEGMKGDLQPFEHGVTYFETIKLPAILYMTTGKRSYLDPVIHALAKLNKYHMLVDGVPSSEEFLNGKTTVSTHETCDITDSMWALGYVLMADGGGRWADTIERICFNALPGAVTKDFKAHQYQSGPNQPVAPTRSGHDEFRLAYRGAHPTLCCSGNVNRAMPNYIARMWMTDGKNGLVAALYGPSRMIADVGNGQTVTVEEMTDYPFSEQIVFKISTRNPIRFALSLRMPTWCESPMIRINGKKLKPSVPGTFLKIEREWKEADLVELELPMRTKTTLWPETGDFMGITAGVALERGPLVYSFPVPEKRTIDTSDNSDHLINTDTGTRTKNLPGWNMEPAGFWAWALRKDDELRGVKFETKKLSGYPLDPDGVNVSLKVPARKVSNWGLRRFKKGGLQRSDTPPLPEHPKCKGPFQDIRLVPLGATCLRVTIFPRI